MSDINSSKEDDPPSVNKEAEQVTESSNVQTDDDVVTVGDDDVVSDDTEPAEQGTTALDYQTKTIEDNELMKELEVTIDSEIVEKFRIGFMDKVMPTLEKSKSSLDEVLSSQNILIETVEQENSKFRECQSIEDLMQTMAKAKKYYAKLLNIKKDMTNLHEKSARLKKRAVRLQQQKQKEELTRAQQRERDHEKERMLAARVAKPSDN